MRDKIEWVTVVICAAVVLIVGKSAWAATNHPCPSTMTNPCTANQQLNCPTGACSTDPESKCLLTQGLSGPPYTEWAWNQAQQQWVATGATFRPEEVHDLVCMCWIPDPENPEEYVLWSGVTRDCCTLVDIEDDAGQNRVATRGACDPGIGCVAGDCEVIPAAGGGITADCQ